MGSSPAAGCWLLAAGAAVFWLAVSLLLLLFKFAQGTEELAYKSGTEDANKLITGILSLIDLSLMGNLLVMVTVRRLREFRLAFRGGHEGQPT